MSLAEVVVDGTLKPDGTLELDQKPDLPPGPVTVVLRQELMMSKDDPFWQRMQAIWAIQADRGHLPRSVKEVEVERHQIREEWEERLQRIEEIQAEAMAVCKDKELRQ